MDNRMSLLTSPFVPEGMVDLMKKLSKGVIKERPSNIYEYAAAFFEKMLIERDGSLDKGYGKFRSYTEYCKFMDKMDQRRLHQTTKRSGDIADMKDTTDSPLEDVVQPTNIEVQGVAIQGVERKSKDSVKNVSINPKYKSQSEKTAKPVVSNVKNVKSKPRKLSSKKPSENLIVIKEETSADVDDNGNGEFKQNKAALAIQKAFRMYMSKKSGQGEQSSQTPLNVSRLSEDAAAVIIQKAFKSLIQKLKPKPQNREKVADESNNNIVISGAGQENTINVDKIISNTDEHSEQILVDDDRTDAKNDLEHNESLQEKTNDEMTANTDIETTNGDQVTALDATGAQQLEETQMELNESVHDGDRAALADNIDESNNIQNLASHQQNEASFPSTTSPVHVEMSKIQEATVPSETSSVDPQLKEEEAVKNDPKYAVGIEVQPSENEVGVSTLENLASNETQVKNISEDPAETEAIVNITEAALENKSNFTDDKDVGIISSESKQGDIAAPLNLSGTDLDVDHSTTATNTGTEIDEVEKKEHVSQLEQTALKDVEQSAALIELSESIPHTSAPDEDLNIVNDNIEKDSSLTDNNLMEEKVGETTVNDQLFVVEKDGIYVNIDLLQEQFGTTTIDDPTGSDNEKTFKLNILEREEILVNQENVQQIGEEAHAMSDDAVCKSSDIISAERRLEILGTEENLPASKSDTKDDEEDNEEPASNCDTKDEEGNEEYELAETVVLMDIPSKSYHESEELLPIAVPENVTIDSMKPNKLDDEIDKLESSVIDELSLEKFSDSIKDKIMNEEVAETKPHVDEIIKNESVVKSLDVMGNQLNKVENSQSTFNVEEVVIKEHDISEEITNPENRLNKVELKASESKDIVKVEGVFAEGETKDENVENQLNESELTKPDSEKILKVEAVLEDDETKDENAESRGNEFAATDSEKIVNVLEVEVKESKDEKVAGQLNKSEFTASNSELIVKAEDIIESEEIKNEDIENQSGKNDLTAVDSEKIVKVEAKFESKEVKSENVESQNKTELTASNSDNIHKLEAVFEDEESKHENIESQFNEIELKANDDENTVKVEAVFEDEVTKNETVESELNKDKSEAALPNSENSSIKGNEIDGVNTNSEHADNQLSENNSANLQVKINNPAENIELVVKSENQLDGEDKKCTAELESIVNEKEDEVVQETTRGEEETIATPSEKIDSLKTEYIIVKRDTDAENTDKIFEENEELVKAATIIQKVFRGYIVRNSPTFTAQGKKDQLELSAALIIQKYARGYLVRRNKQKIDNLNIDTNGTEDNSNTEVVPQLPAYSNRFLIPKDSFLERESFADDEDYARTCKELAATSIQKTYRGYRVRRSLKTSMESDAATDDIRPEVENGIESFGGNDQVQTAVNEAERVISDVLNVAADVLPLESYDLDSFEDEVTDDKNVELESKEIADELSVDHGSVLGQVVHDNIHVEGQMQQKYNQMKFQGSPINPIEETSDSSDPPETPRKKPAHASTVKSKTLESDSLDSKDYDGSKSFSYEQLSSDLSDTDENKRESQKESEVDETSRDERDDLSEVENFDLSSCGEDSLEAMYYSLRKNEIMVDKMQKQLADQRVPKNNEIACDGSENFRVEFPERVTENLDVAMQQVCKSMESSTDYDGGKKDEDDNSSTLDLALDDSSSINDEKEIETSREVKQSEEVNLEDIEESESTADAHAKDVDQSFESTMERDVETSNIEQSEQSDSSADISRHVASSNMEQSQQSDSSVNSSTRFIMKSQSVSEDMMNPIMFAMKRKQALIDQLHVRPYPLQENLSEDHDAFPEHLLSDIDIGNIQRKIFASSVSETDSDYIEPNTTGRRLVRDDFNISTALDHLSTDSDSTIVSAATKIQAGARGFLTRRRLRRSSAGGTSISFEKRYSFGNAAIDKSLEDLIKMQEQINLDGAALKIQQQYRRYQARKNNLKKVSPIREQTTLELSGGSSMEGNEGTGDNIGIREITLAQKKVDDYPENVKEKVEDHPIGLNIDTVDTVEPVKRTPVNQRRLTLQRGDAVQRNSRPDSQDLNIKDGDLASPDNQSTGPFKDSETGKYTGTTDSKPVKKVTAYKNIQSLISRGIGPRQRSMPVQIDSELMRIIPKHLRKRVKSADMAKKKSG